MRTFSEKDTNGRENKAGVVYSFDHHSSFRSDDHRDHQSSLPMPQNKLEIFALVLQLLASISWVISIFIYDSFEHGDVWQLIAAFSWTISNLATGAEMLSSRNKAHGKDCKKGEKIAAQGLFSIDANPTTPVDE